MSARPTWIPRPVEKIMERVIEREEPKGPNVWGCVMGDHRADVLHKGTSYCRSCYDEKNRLGELIN